MWERWSNKGRPLVCVCATRLTSKAQRSAVGAEPAQSQAPPSSWPWCKCAPPMSNLAIACNHSLWEKETIKWYYWCIALLCNVWLPPLLSAEPQKCSASTFSNHHTIYRFLLMEENVWGTIDAVCCCNLRSNGRHFLHTEMCVRKCYTYRIIYLNIQWTWVG